MTTIKAHSIRFVLYALIILYRTYILYLAGGYMQSTLQDSSSSTSCWYASLTRDGTCKDHFDYSDHIVLYLAQYGVPLSIELAYVYSITNHNRYHMLLRYFLTVMVSVVLLGVCIRGVLLTSMFFHTGVFLDTPSILLHMQKKAPRTLLIIYPYEFPPPTNTSFTTHSHHFLCYHF